MLLYAALCYAALCGVVCDCAIHWLCCFALVCIAVYWFQLNIKCQNWSKYVKVRSGSFLLRVINILLCFAECYCKCKANIRFDVWNCLKFSDTLIRVNMTGSVAGFFRFLCFSFFSLCFIF